MPTDNMHLSFTAAASLRDANFTTLQEPAVNISRQLCNVSKSFTSTFLPTVYVIVFCVGLIGNCLGLSSLFRNWKRLGSINMFVLNLGVADLLYVFTLPFLVHYYATHRHWPFGPSFCKMTRFCFNLNLYGSIGFLTCISVYRYLGIVHPMEVMGRIRSYHTLCICALVWILVIAVISPDLYFDKTLPGLSNGSCYDTTTNDYISAYLYYSLVWTTLGFCVPLVIILGCYGHIAIVLSRNKNVEPPLKQKCLRLVVILVVLFVVCFIPYHVLRNWNLRTRILQLQGQCKPAFGRIYISYQVSRGLASINSAFNPLVYLITNDDFQTRVSEFSQRARRSVALLKERKGPEGLLDKSDSNEMKTLDVCGH
ncbi:P2Y purinoceptor 1-like [Erpetoichthys calabaricus]|uniref:P2Y purinoceptor 1-like n=1 Tax=Erpetoichthys calabaricus TaxID=27687 RepID=A0A8C4TJJ8_ERPCA|nr:P2Y purinoceptor 1-like [Erpetoichthys calabaricus]